jgi:hypothetical protein
MLSQIRDLVVLFMCYCFADTLFSSFADYRFTRSYSAIEVYIYFKMLEVKVPIVFFSGTQGWTLLEKDSRWNKRSDQPLLIPNSE